MGTVINATGGDGEQCLTAKCKRLLLASVVLAISLLLFFASNKTKASQLVLRTNISIDAQSNNMHRHLFNWMDPKSITPRFSHNLITDDLFGVPPAYHDDYIYCNQHNSILVQGSWRVGTPDTRPTPPYSITKDSFAFFHSKHASTLEELLYAVKYGQRVWRDPTMVNSEKAPSYFVPAQYDIPPIKAKDACDIMGKYSHIITVGDSLSRHLRMAIFMILRRDLIAGAIISDNKHQDDNPYGCHCDGQFSEHPVCRQNDGLFEDTMPRDMGLCSELTDDHQFRFFSVAGFRNPRGVEAADWKAANCTSPTSRGVLLYMQGGPHFKTIAHDYQVVGIEPIISSPEFMECVQHEKVHVVWSSYTAVALSMNAAYPHQAREKALEFNEEMELYWSKQPFPVITLDWFNLTKDSQTSDGFHSLSEINLAKATQLLHVLRLIQT